MNKTLMIIIFITITILSYTALANTIGSGPYCVVTTGLKQCHYYTVESCQQAARLVNGICQAR